LGRRTARASSILEGGPQLRRAQRSNSLPPGAAGQAECTPGCGDAVGVEGQIREAIKGDGEGGRGCDRYVVIEDGVRTFVDLWLNRLLLLGLLGGLGRSGSPAPLRRRHTQARRVWGVESRLDERCGEVLVLVPSWFFLGRAAIGWAPERARPSEYRITCWGRKRGVEG